VLGIPLYDAEDWHVCKIFEYWRPGIDDEWFARTGRALHAAHGSSCCRCAASFFGWWYFSFCVVVFYGFNGDELYRMPKRAFHPVWAVHSSHGAEFSSFKANKECPRYLVPGATRTTVGVLCRDLQSSVLLLAPGGNRKTFTAEFFLVAIAMVGEMPACFLLVVVKNKSRTNRFCREEGGESRLT